MSPVNLLALVADAAAPLSCPASEEFGATDKVLFTSSPEEALKGADVVVTDTWISMGQEEESAKRLKDFAGFQVTESTSFTRPATAALLFLTLPCRPCVRRALQAGRRLARLEVHALPASAP